MLPSTSLVHAWALLHVCVMVFDHSPLLHDCLDASLPPELVDIISSYLQNSLEVDDMFAVMSRNNAIWRTSIIGGVTDEHYEFRYLTSGGCSPPFRVLKSSDLYRELSEFPDEYQYLVHGNDFFEVRDRTRQKARNDVELLKIMDSLDGISDAEKFGCFYYCFDKDIEKAKEVMATIEKIVEFASKN